MTTVSEIIITTISIYEVKFINSLNLESFNWALKTITIWYKKNIYYLVCLVRATRTGHPAKDITLFQYIHSIYQSRQVPDQLSWHNWQGDGLWIQRCRVQAESGSAHCLWQKMSSPFLSQVEKSPVTSKGQASPDYINVTPTNMVRIRLPLYHWNTVKTMSNPPQTNESNRLWQFWTT